MLTKEMFPSEPVAKELARRNDPEESKTAAREIVPKLGNLQRTVLRLVTEYPDRTAAELLWDVCNFATARSYDARWIGRRLPELAAQGRVFKSGSRRCTTTGKTAATWRAV